MANTMTTFVRVDNINEEVLSFFQSVVDTDPEKTHYPHTPNGLRFINSLYGTEFTKDSLWDIGWGNENLGSKWVRFDWIEIDDDSIRFNLESAWHFPQEFIQKLTERVTSIYPDTIVTGTYEDEEYDPCGAYFFAKDYDDVEDFDDDIDYQLMWDDDTYRESILDELEEIRQSLEDNYNEYLEDRKNNPQDYE